MLYMGSRLFLAVAAMTLVAAGCGRPVVRICEEKAACEGYSEQEQEQCEEQLVIQGDQAGAMDCSSEWDAFLDCGENQGTCEDGEWSFGDLCATEEAAYLGCLGVVPPGDDDDSAGSGDDDDSAAPGDDDDSAAPGDDDDSAVPGDDDDSAAIP